MTRVKLSLTGADARVQGFDRLGADVQAALVATSQALASRLAARVQQDTVSGQTLDRLSGALAGALATTVDAGDGVVTAKVYLEDPPPYAAILAFGGVIPAHEIRPVSAQALSFIEDGRRVFAKIAHIPDVTTPAQADPRASLEDMADEITSELQQAVVRTLRGQSS